MIPKEMWPKAMVEGKRMAEYVHAKNRELEKFSVASPNSPPSDRELLLGAAVMVFWDYKLQQEAKAAARRLTIEKTIRYLEIMATTDLEPRRLLKAWRRTANNTEGYGFLQMWGLVDRFLRVSSIPAYWQQEEFKSDPSIAIRALMSDLERVAAQGESNGEEKGSNENGTTGGTLSTEGDPNQANAAAMRTEVGPGGETNQGEDRPTEGVRGGGEGLEAEASGVQEPN